MEEIVVNRNVDVPPATRGGRFARAASKMKIGDCVLVSNHMEAESVRSALRRLGRKGRRKKEGDGIRVWRVE